MNLKKRSLLVVLLVLGILTVSLVGGEFLENTNEFWAVSYCLDVDGSYTGFGSDTQGIVWTPVGESPPVCYDEGGGQIGCSYHNTNLVNQHMGAIEQTTSGDSVSNVGCWALGGDVGGWDDCASVIVKIGHIIEGQYTWNWNNDFNYKDWEEGDPKKIFDGTRTFFNIGGPKICSDDHYWHGCALNDEGKADNSFTWSTGYLYQCQNVEDIAAWVKLGKDLDHDGYVEQNFVESGAEINDKPITKFDCKDYDTSTYGINSDCPETPEECNADSTNCAICIHPERGEICGDGADNDCNSLTSDNCNEFKEGCEQTLVTTDEQETPLLDQQSVLIYEC